MRPACNSIPTKHRGPAGVSAGKREGITRQIRSAVTPNGSWELKRLGGLPMCVTTRLTGPIHRRQISGNAKRSRSCSRLTANQNVEWSAVIAGAVAAVAVSCILLSFGAALGLASASPWTSTATGLKAAGVGAAFWMLLVTVWSFALGGYLAGRLRHPWRTE